ncbi:CDP-diacylglycerol--serine O-phosphatidyltransferase [Zavarzinia sp. CC-PAN008]|uniref:CDP-diacylglycerol--serine O-phosphatidyltransferase n=1 Tax=Zavarzinia sp. CC-PAN008 TaxID=3243332 RepID=UPI003F74213E
MARGTLRSRFRRPLKGRRARRPLPNLPLRVLVPNMLTVLALCSGLSAIRFAMMERYDLAVTAVLVAMLFDGLDGRIARLLKGTSRFGAELDSLSDFVSFGVAPMLVLYQWTLSTLGGLGWIVVLAFATCGALRLARFNVAAVDPDRPIWASQYFTGVPAPAGAGLVLLPLATSFWLGEDLRQPHLVAVLALVVAFLMISRIPTFAFKKVRIPRDAVLPVLVGVGIGFAVVVSYSWESYTFALLAYLATIPLSIASYRRQLASHRQRGAETRAAIIGDAGDPPVSPS